MPTIRTNKTKEQFISEMKQRIEIRNEIVSFIETIFFPIIKKFDGKIYNKRIINALNEEAKKTNKLMLVKKAFSSEDIEIQIRLSTWSYNDYEAIILKMNTKGDGRIDYDSTKNDDLNNKWICNFNKYTEDYKKSIDKYDEYMNMFVKLNEVVDEYNKLPHPFRNHLDKSWLHIY